MRELTIEERAMIRHQAAEIRDVHAQKSAHMNKYEPMAKKLHKFMSATGSLGILLIGLALCATTIVRANAEESEPGLLTRAEANFLHENCPETTQLVESGAVLVYGNIIEPPILVAREQGKIYVAGFRVSPLETRPTNLAAKNKVNRIQTQYFLEKKAGVSDPFGKARERAAELVRSGRAKSFEFMPGKTERLSITVGDAEAHHTLDALPGSVVNKDAFIYKMLFGTYSLRKKTYGKEASLAWLRVRFDDLKKMGIIFSYDMHEATEAVYVKLFSSDFSSGYGFYGPDTPKAEDYEKEWKSREAQTQEQIAEIVRRLKSGELLIYSYRFDAHIPLKREVLDSLRAVRGAQGGKNQKVQLRDALGVTENQVNTLLEELE